MYITDRGLVFKIPEQNYKSKEKFQKYIRKMK